MHMHVRMTSYLHTGSVVSYGISSLRLLLFTFLYRNELYSEGRSSISVGFTQFHPRHGLCGGSLPQPLLQARGDKIHRRIALARSLLLTTPTGSSLACTFLFTSRPASSSSLPLNPPAQPTGAQRASQAGGSGARAACSFLPSAPPRSSAAWTYVRSTGAHLLASARRRRMTS